MREVEDNGNYLLIGFIDARTSAPEEEQEDDLDEAEAEEDDHPEKDGDGGKARTEYVEHDHQLDGDELRTEVTPQ